MAEATLCGPEPPLGHTGTRTVIVQEHSNPLALRLGQNFVKAGEHARMLGLHTSSLSSGDSGGLESAAACRETDCI